MSNNGLQFFTPFQRTFKGPLDVSLVFDTSAEMNQFLDSETKYAGQVVACKEFEGSLFILNNAENQWLLLTSEPDKHKSYSVEHSMEEIIEHNLNKYPSVQIKSESGFNCIAEIKHININSTKITWLDHFSGTVIFN